MKRLALAGGITALLVLAITGAGISEDRPAGVGYPDGYRGWTHVKSMVIEGGHPLYGAFGGIHHVYANKKALKGLEENRYEDGSVFVFDLLEAERDENAISEGPRKVIGVMEKGQKRFQATGGWGFEGFKGDSGERTVKDPVADCFSCHEPEKKTEFVFSRYRR